MSLRVRLPNPLTALDDRALLALFAEERDQPAFEQLVKRHGGLVLGVCRRAVRDRHLAEDAFQAVFLVLARDPKRAAGAASVGGWLFGVARRVGLAARRHELRREKRELAANPLRESGDAGAEFGDLLRVLDEELAALPEELRAALVACFLEERTQDEAAHELRWSLSTLRRRLERGKELLRARLARRGVALAAGLLTVAVASPARAAAPALAVTPSHTSTALAAEVVRRGVGAKLAALVAVVSLTAGGLAFGLARDSDAAPEVPAPIHPAAPDRAPTPAPAPRAVETKKWVAVSGRVVFPKDRDIPQPRPVPAGQVKDANVWKQLGPPVYEDTLVNADNRGLANVIVYLRPDSDDRKAEFPADKIHPDLAKPKPIDHTVFAAGGQFAPRVLAVRAGDRVTFENRLPVPTNVRYDSSNAESTFNVLLGREMTHTSKALVAGQTPDHFTSTIYPWMRGFVRVFDHPYFAVTDADGRFEIAKVPAGTWRLVVWHETTGYLGGAPGRLGTKLTVPETRTGKTDLVPQTFESKNWPE
jgi:RNA polymerase sigma factor (sigma-70 family)